MLLRKFLAISLFVSPVQADVLGDVNQDDLVDAADLVLVQQAVVGQISLDAQQTVRADLYPSGGDGLIDVADMTLLEQLIAVP